MGTAALLLALLGACATGRATPAADPGDTTATTTGTGATAGDGAPAAGGISLGNPDLVPDDHTGPYAALGTVLQSPDHGPQLCHAVATSYPPQCSGLDLAGWDWAALPAGSHESQNGTTWGDFVVVGTLAGTTEQDGTLTLTEPPRLPGDAGDLLPVARDPAAGFDSPCPEPAGGWRAPDPARATEETLQAALTRAERLDGYGGSWIDAPPVSGEPRPDPEDDPALDPANQVLNVSTTGDVAAAEQALREVWGGPLCVSTARRAYADLLTVQADLDRREGLLQSSIDVVTGEVVGYFLVARQSLQEELDATHGAGVVRLEAVLHPVRG
ncbi:hypothetical protein [Kineococcus glutinatus]|uniref:Uncharacterized protein n=1 Tax=Kineococcus glutinatus TaxID=1070872 RepID=A0ABP9H7Z4_9ACTN